MSKRPEADRLRMVIETQSEIVSSRLDVDEVMQRVVERAQEVTDAAAAVVEMAEGEDMVYRAVSGTAKPFLGLRVEAASSLSGLCVETGQLLRSDDATTDPRTNTEICVRVGAVSMICLPLRHRQGDTVGVLKVYAPTTDAFDTADEETLGLLSGLIAAHLSNAKDFAAARDESRRDALTGLGNRRAYDEALTREAARAARYGSLLSLVLFDVDGFKAVNDLHGHPARRRGARRGRPASRERPHIGPGVPSGWRRVRARAGRDGVGRRPARRRAPGRGGGDERSDSGPGHALDGSRRGTVAGSARPPHRGRRGAPPVEADPGRDGGAAL